MIFNQMIFQKKKRIKKSLFGGRAVSLRKHVGHGSLTIAEGVVNVSQAAGTACPKLSRDEQETVYPEN